MSDPAPEPKFWEDPEFLSWLKAQPEFSRPDPPAAVPPPARGGGDDSVTQKILSALEKLGEKNAPASAPSAPPAPAIVEKIVEKAHSWFIDD